MRWGEGGGGLLTIYLVLCVSSIYLSIYRFVYLFICYGIPDNGSDRRLCLFVIIVVYIKQTKNTSVCLTNQLTDAASKFPQVEKIAHART